MREKRKGKKKKSCMRSKLWCIKIILIIFCLLKRLRLWTLSKKSMPGEFQSLFRQRQTKTCPTTLIAEKRIP